MKPTSQMMMVRLDSVRLEPAISATSTVVDLASVERELGRLEVGLATLLVSSASAEGPSEALVKDAWTTLMQTHDAEAMGRMLNIPVVELPLEHKGWTAAVLLTLQEDQLQQPVLFYQLPMRNTVPMSTDPLLSLLDRTSEAVRSWFGAPAEHVHSPERRRERFPWEELKRTGISGLEPTGAAEKVSAPATDSELPPATIAARARRDELLKSERWLSSAEVAQQARGQLLESNPHQHASRLRRERRLFGARLGGQYLHPEFQFIPATGEPHPAMADLMARLPGEDNGWAAALWLFAPTLKLGGERPADVFQARPADVVDAARRDFEGDDADW
jgi:hypothetical protein